MWPTYVRCDLAQLIVQRLGQGGEELCLARVALMAGYADVIEESMELADDGRDLLRQV